MANFDERQKGFENKFKHDQETTFKVNARRNKLLGLWAAKQMGLSGQAADDYAKTVVIADMEKAGDDDVMQKVLKDLTAKGVEVTPHRVRAEMDSLLAIAREQITEK